MKVSIIVPFYSNIEWLEEAVNSVFEQSFTDFELIIVNDGSPEDDVDFLKKYGKRLSYYKTENRGPASARNFGIRKAKGEYLAFLDSDDIWLGDKLEKQISFMLDTNSVWSHTNYYTFSNETSEILGYNVLQNFSGFIFPKSLAKTHIATPSVIVKREVLVENGLFFQEKMRFGQDYYLWLKLSELYKLDLVPEYLLKVRVRGTNAAIRARAHIQVRGQIWNLLKNDNIFKGVKFKKIFQFTYWICSVENKFLCSIEKKVNKNIIEKISKVLYIFPYVMFKLLFKIS